MLVRSLQESVKLVSIMVCHTGTADAVFKKEVPAHEERTNVVGLGETEVPTAKSKGKVRHEVPQ